MAPNKKASQLVSKYWNMQGVMNMADAKKLALKEVDEIEDSTEELSHMEYGGKSYWQEVKTQINLL